jgi:hypothetical protein
MGVRSGGQRSDWPLGLLNDRLICRLMDSPIGCLADRFTDQQRDPLTDRFTCPRVDGAVDWPTV